MKISIGFIGAGNMGLPMLKNLKKDGFDIKVYDQDKKVTKKLEKDKIKSVNNLRAVANNDFIISILPDTTDVESVFNYETGINQFLLSPITFNICYCLSETFFNWCSY